MAGMTGTQSDGAFGPGIAQALAQRRAMQISDIRYDLALDLTATDRATGNLAATFTRRDGSGDLVLDFRGPLLAELVVNGQPVPPASSRDGRILLRKSLL